MKKLITILILIFCFTKQILPMQSIVIIESAKSSLSESDSDSSSPYKYELEDIKQNNKLKGSRNSSDIDQLPEISEIQEILEINGIEKNISKALERFNVRLSLKLDHNPVYTSQIIYKFLTDFKESIDNNSKVTEKNLQEDFKENLSAEDIYKLSIVKLINQVGSKTVHESIIEDYIKALTDVNLINSSGETPLTVAAKHGHLLVAKSLLALGAKINKKNIDKETALMVATRNDQEAIVELLVKNNAKVNVRNKFGDTALLLAVIRADSYIKSRKIINLLLDANADPYVTNNFGYTINDCIINRQELKELFPENDNYLCEIL